MERSHRSEQPKANTPNPYEFLKKEVLDEMTAAELVRFADAHRLLVGVTHGTASSEEIAVLQLFPDRTSMRAQQKNDGVSDLTYDRVLTEDDSCWHAFGAPRRVRLPKTGRGLTSGELFYLELPAVAEYNDRILAIQEAGYFEAVKGECINEMMRINDTYLKLGAAIQTWAETRSLITKLSLGSLKGASLDDRIRTFTETVRENSGAKRFDYSMQPSYKSLLDALTTARSASSLSEKEVQILDWFAQALEALRVQEDRIDNLRIFANAPFVLPARDAYERGGSFHKKYVIPILAALREQDPATALVDDCERMTPQQYYAKHVSNELVDQIREHLQFYLEGQTGANIKSTNPYR